MQDVSVTKLLAVYFANCFCETCIDEGCQLSVHQALRHQVAIIAGTRVQEKLESSDPLCDCLVFVGSNAVAFAPTELKGGKPDAGKVINQLQKASSLVAETRIPTKAFLPVLLFGGGMSRFAMSEISQKPHHIQREETTCDT